MKNYKENILAFFDDEMKLAMRNLCAMINQSQADVFILMAHKAVLLFFVLLDQGYISERIRSKRIITNLSLGFDKSFFEPNMKIAIVDDIVISGTTIARAVHELIECGINQDNIDVYTIALDKEYFNMRFEKKSGEKALHYGIIMDDARCIELSAVISKAFSYLGVPYDVDFPVYQQIPLSDKQIKYLYNNLLWNAVDISNQNQISGGITALSLLPSDYTRNQIWLSVGYNLEECVDLKMRLYIKKMGNGAIECCAVPMCLFREISESDINKLYNAFALKRADKIDNNNASLRSKTRFVAYYLSHYIFTCFSVQMNISAEFSLYKELVEVLFGPKYGLKIHSTLSSIKTLSNSKTAHPVKKAYASYGDFIKEYHKSEEYTEYDLEVKSWDRFIGNQSSSYELGYWLNYYILHPVIWWYKEKEINTRNKLKSTSYSYVNNYDKIKGHLHRLEKVIPMGLLIQLLKEKVCKLNDDECQTLISIFLDRAIDEGIIVPTLYYDDTEKYICRAYRHGEDLPFGDADKTRLVYFLQILGNKISEENGSRPVQISAIALEKIIVLFYQIGLYHGGIFNRFLGFDNTDIIHSFLSIHGAIVGFTSHDAIEHIYSAKSEIGEKYITWLTKWLSIKSLISYPGKVWEDVHNEDTSSAALAEIKLDKIGLYLTKERMSVISDNVQGGIKSIADLISQWYTGMIREERPKDFKEYVTILTSCSNKIVFASAIATEIHYFSTYWRKQGIESLEQPDGDSIKAFLCRSYAKNYTDNTRKGLHSGKDKIGWYEKVVLNNHTHSDEPLVENVIEQSTCYLRSETDKKYWKETWKGIRNVEVDSDSGLQQLSNLANAYLFLYFTCFLCLNNPEFWERGTLPDQYEEYKLQCLRYQKFDEYYNDLLRIACETDIEQKKTLFKELIDHATNNSEQYCVAKIEEAVWKCDPSFTVRYKSCIIMEINAFDPCVLNDVFMRFWNNLAQKGDLPENTDLTTINIIRFPDDSDGDFIKFGIFCNPDTRKPVDSFGYADSNGCIERLLLSFYDEICMLLTAKVKQIKAVLIPEIGNYPGLYFKHNLKRNIDKSCREFYNSQIQHIEKCFSNCITDKNISEQIVVCCGPYTSFRTDLFEGWDKQESGSCVQNVSWISEWFRFSRFYVKMPCTTESKILYSLVLINSDQNPGMGVLVKCSDRIVCVSCNHVFNDFPNNHYAQFYQNRGLNSFALKLGENESIKSYRDDSDLLCAEDELIILEPCWDGRIPLDADLLVTPGDFSQLQKNNTDCSIYALNENVETQIYSLIVRQEIEKGYYQLDCRDKDDEALNKKGWSGGVYFQDNTNSTIIGIHYGRFDEQRRIRMIPSNLIKNILEKYLGGR